jgi:hypothetical protein
LKDALYLLGRLLSDTEAKERLSSVLEILMLQSLAFNAQGERHKTLSTLVLLPLTLFHPLKSIPIYFFSMLYLTCFVHTCSRPGVRIVALTRCG